MTASGAPDRRPDPDPSRLTTDQLRRELSNLRELIEARLDGMDKANQVLAENVVAQARLAEQSVDHLKALHDERFLSVDQQFRERDIRDKMASTDAKDAIAAALTAARERAQITNDANAATAERVERSLSAQLQQIGQLAEAGRNQLADQIASLKERIDRGEGSDLGAAGAHSEQRLNISTVIAAVATLVAVLGFVLYAIKP